MTSIEKGLTTIIESLDKKEKSELEKLEKKISNGIESFLLIGEALAEISDKRLYRIFGSFEDYCEQRWDIHRQTGYKLINSWKTFTGLKQIGYEDQLPNTESQYRELSKVKDVNKQVEILKRLNDLYPDRPITAKQIRDVVTAYKISDTEGAVDENPPKTKREKLKSKVELSLPIDSVKIGKNGISFRNPDDEKVKNFMEVLQQNLKENGKIDFYYARVADNKKSKKEGPKNNGAEYVDTTKEEQERLIEEFKNQ
jgi:hypothetical protein